MILVLNIQVLFCVHLCGLLNSANKMSIFSLIIFCKVMRWAMFLSLKIHIFAGSVRTRFFEALRQPYESHCLPNENFTSQRGFITDPTQAIIYWTTYFIKICFYAIFHHTHIHHPLLPINNRVNSSMSSPKFFLSAVVLLSLSFI